MTSEIDLVKAKNTDLSEKVEQLSKEKGENEGLSRSQRAEIDDLKGKLGAARAEDRKDDDEIRRLREELEKAKRDDGSDDALIKSLKAEVAELRGKLAEAKKDDKADDQEIQSLKNEVASLKASAAAAGAATTAAPAGDAAALEKENKRLAKEKEIVMQKLVEAKTEIVALKGSEEVKKLTDENAKLKADLAAAKKDDKADDAQIKKLTDETAKLKADLSVAKKDDKADDAQIKKLSDEVSALKAELAKAKAGAAAAPAAAAAAPAAAPAAAAAVGRKTSMATAVAPVLSPGKSYDGLPKLEQDDGRTLYFPSDAQLDSLHGLLAGEEGVTISDVTAKFSAVPEHVMMDWLIWMSLHCKRLGKLMTLTQIATRALSNMEEQMAAIAEAACAALECERATIFSADPRKRQLVSMVAMKSQVLEAEVRSKTDSGLKKKYKDRRVVSKRQFLEIRIPDDEGIAGHVFSTGEVVNIPDCYEDYRFNKEVDKKSGLKTRQMLCVPVMVHGGLKVGVLQVMNRKKVADPFTEEHRVKLEALAVQAGVHLYRTSIVSEAREVTEKNPLIDSVMSTYLEEVSLDRVMQQIVSDVIRVLECERATVFVADEATEELFSLLPDGTEIRMPWSKGLAGECFQTRAPINIPEPYKDPRFNDAFDKKSGFKTRSILCFPLYSRELDADGKPKVVGAVQALNKGDPSGPGEEHTPFTEEDEMYFGREVAYAGANLAYSKLFEDAAI